MNETNILAGVEVPHVDVDFVTLYNMQYKLQERLEQLPKELDYAQMARKCIYWGHCVRAEIVELVEWLVAQDNPTWIKELQMEAIDIVHFVFNIGLEIGLTADTINALEQNYDHQDWLIEAGRIQAASILLETSIINLVNSMPWKTWKTYKEPAQLHVLAEGFENVLRASLMLCNASNLNRQKIINMYCAKNKVNHVRQDNGY